jgi:hypothetical protein
MNTYVLEYGELPGLGFKAQRSIKKNLIAIRSPTFLSIGLKCTRECRPMYIGGGRSSDFYGMF